MIRVIGCTRCTPYLADKDLWMRPEARPSTREKYWSYVLCYVDNVLVIHHDAMRVLNIIGKFFKMKDDANKGELDMYLGVKLRKIKMSNGVEAWTLSPSKYVQETVRNCKKYVNANVEHTLTYTRMF